MYLVGQVTTDDGTRLPSNVMVERVCNANVRQQVYASGDGDFSMQLGSVNDSTLDATAEGSSQPTLPDQFSNTGIPRRLLANCELRASVAGFASPTISLIGLDPSGKTLQVGTIRVHRRAKIEGATLSAAAYKGVPKAAVTAYEKGLGAARDGKLASAQKQFEKAVQIHPTYAHAWFQLGTVLQRKNDREGARTAYKRATTIDDRFLAPHLALASLAFEDGNWREVLSFTNPILELDPFKNMTGYTKELDPFNYAETYYYDAVAHYELNQFDAAEKSALKAEQLLARSPQLHLLLGEIFAQEKNYVSAISEIKTYLELVPKAENADHIRERLAELERESNALLSGRESTHN
jgi:DNA-binding SARP family transcriptional activator